MTALQRTLSLGLVLLIAAANGCACLSGKHCGGGVGCCDAGCEVGCDVGCGVEGCGDCCGPNGCDMAFQKYKGCCKPRIPFCVCTGDACCDTGCCDAGCGCEIGCGCEADCAVDPGCCADDCCADPCCGADACGDACGCGDTCRPCGTCLYNVKYALGKLFGGLVGCCGCSGCDGEVYWSEWHNDPPRCCDPCDKCGNWVGPASGYRAPYDHPCGCN